MKPLTSGQRKFLRSEAHHLDPVVLVGKGGITDMLIRAAADAVEAHELIKVKFNGFKDQKRDLTDEIAQRTGAQTVSIIGNIAILYKRHPEPEKRKIRLPD